jgi:hypothetical protein
MQEHMSLSTKRRLWVYITAGPPSTVKQNYIDRLYTNHIDFTSSPEPTLNYPSISDIKVISFNTHIHYGNADPIT